MILGDDQGTLHHFQALSDLAVKFKDGADAPTDEDVALMSARYKGEEPIFHKQQQMGGEWTAEAAAM